jgi:hypothetical protein
MPSLGAPLLLPPPPPPPPPQLNGFVGRPLVAKWGEELHTGASACVTLEEHTCRAGYSCLWGALGEAFPSSAQIVVPPPAWHRVPRLLLSPILNSIPYGPLADGWCWRRQGRLPHRAHHGGVLFHILHPEGPHGGGPGQLPHQAGAPPHAPAGHLCCCQPASAALGLGCKHASMAGGGWRSREARGVSAPPQVPHSRG